MAEENPEDVIMVEVFEAKPNRMLGEALRALTRFLRFERAVPCQECGRKSKHHWTMLIPFAAYTMPTNAFKATVSGKRHAPGAPVCRAHPMAPLDVETNEPQPEGEPPHAD